MTDELTKDIPLPPIDLELLAKAAENFKREAVKDSLNIQRQRKTRHDYSLHIQSLFDLAIVATFAGGFFCFGMAFSRYLQ